MGRQFFLKALGGCRIESWPHTVDGSSGITV